MALMFSEMQENSRKVVQIQHSFNRSTEAAFEEIENCYFLHYNVKTQTFPAQ